MKCVLELVKSVVEVVVYITALLLHDEIKATTLLHKHVAGGDGDPRGHLRPLCRLDAAGEGKNFRGKPERTNQERYQL